MPEVRLIDANSALNDLCGSQCGCRVDECGLDEPCEKARCIIRQPTIEPEVRHGRWIPTEYDSYADGAPVWDKWECSECGHEHSGEEDTLTAFCPDCGARMDAEDNQGGSE